MGCVLGLACNATSASRMPLFCRSDLSPSANRSSFQILAVGTGLSYQSLSPVAADIPSIPHYTTKLRVQSEASRARPCYLVRLRANGNIKAHGTYYRWTDRESSIEHMTSSLTACLVATGIQALLYFPGLPILPWSPLALGLADSIFLPNCRADDMHCRSWKDLKRYSRHAHLKAFGVSWAVVDLQRR